MLPTRQWHPSQLQAAGAAKMVRKGWILLSHPLLVGDQEGRFDTQRFSLSHPTHGHVETKFYDQVYGLQGQAAGASWSSRKSKERQKKGPMLQRDTLVAL